MSELLHCHGALALELRTPPARDRIERDAAETLAGLVADDLQRLVPGVEQADLVFAALHYDPAELLRPGWPIHAVLAQIAQRAPGAGRRRVIALGARAGAVPGEVLEPDARLQGGPLRLLPFVLAGEPQVLDRLGRTIEERLLETGMAGAATALEAQQAFGAALEHARYLSLHDLCAMTALQYEHAGLAGLWPLIEAALLDPGAEEWLDAAPEPLLRYRAGEVRAASPSLVAWKRAGLAPASAADSAAEARAFAAHNARLAQLRAVLEAHAIAVTRVDVGDDEDIRARLR